MDGPQSWSGCCDEKEKIPSVTLLGIEPRSSNPWPSHYTNYPGPVHVLEPYKTTNKIDFTNACSVFKENMKRY